jgi:predicted TIM-barrel enzyme
VAEAREAVPEGFILVGSGVDQSNAVPLLAAADGAIVGTGLKREGLVSNLVDPERVRRMAEIIHSLV